jgi:hypothetical protein
MGNYNCQECITKEANLINELLLDSNLLYSEEASIEESKTHESKIRTKKSNKHQPSQEDLKKLLDKKNLSKEQKKFVEKIINKDSEIPDIKITNLEPVENNNNDAIIIQNSESPKNRNEKLELTHDENEETLKSKKFKIETYEPLSNNNDNYNMDYLFEKSDRGDEPQDSMRPDFRKPIIPKGNSNNSSNKKSLGPRDSLRKSNNIDIKENNNNDNINNNKIPMNRGEIENINNNKNNINEDEKINNNTLKSQKFLSPCNKQLLHIEPTDNNKIPNNNTDNERKVITSGPYLNQVEELKNAYTSGNIINSINTREKNERPQYQESSYRDMEITISERESTLHLYDDKGGNMNYLEKQYQAYQNKKRYFYDDENF